MNVAGRKIVVSMSMPTRPGRSSSIAASTPRVTSSVFAHGNFSTMSMSPGPSLMTASPASGWWSSTRRAMSWSGTSSPSAFSTTMWDMSVGETIGATLWMASR